MVHLGTSLPAACGSTHPSLTLTTEAAAVTCAACLTAWTSSAPVVAPPIPAAEADMTQLSTQIPANVTPMKKRPAKRKKG